MRFAQIEVALDSASCFVRELALTEKVIRPLPLGGDHQKFDFIVKLSKFLVPVIAAAVVLHMPKAHAVLGVQRRYGARRKAALRS